MVHVMISLDSDFQGSWWVILQHLLITFSFFAKPRRKIEFCPSTLLLGPIRVEFEGGFMEYRASSEGDHAIAMEIHLLLCILVTALLSLELYAQFFFKFLSKRTELFTAITLFSIFSLGVVKLKVLDLTSGCRLKYKICNSMTVLQRFNSLVEDSCVIANGGDSQLIQDSDDGESDELSPEDQLFDVMSLRELVKAERRRADLAVLELEKERASAATAAEEALSMILRLQSEKSSIEIESNHCRRLAEQKQQYDQQVIEFLRNVVMEQGIEKGLLENELRLYSHCQHDNVFGEGDEDGVSSAMEDRFCYKDGEEEDELISSLEFDSWSL